MVPLFMAGDKEFYQYGRSLRKEAGLDLTVFCSGHLLEQREFFVGFCGVNRNVSTTARAYDYHRLAKMQLAFYYIGQYLRNPAYINRSFFDSVRSFLVTFLSKDDFLYLYEYLRWDEKEMERVLRENYDWEDSTQFGKSQWRMGDGHTAFTNYIWHTVAGFSEFDNFRSNQVREGLLTREEAVELAEEDNRPKMESLEYFAYLVGFNLDDVLSQINTIPKMY
jgi:glucosamine--fructose-6-phosphate aminotransferase (isomerizing)